MKYLYLNHIIFLHNEIIKSAGGSEGLRDQGLLESAVYRPQASFGGHDLYPDIFSKASALIHSLIKNHPFVDGNKRTGFEAMRLLLSLNGWDLQASESEKFNWIIRIASDSSYDEHQIAEWIQAHAKKYPGLKH